MPVFAIFYGEMFEVCYIEVSIVYVFSTCSEIMQVFPFLNVMILLSKLNLFQHYDCYIYVDMYSCLCA
jgi:hypothetical protein